MTGLEAALVDTARLRVSSLEPHDTRTFTFAVAGRAALLIAKLYKLHERSSQPQRLKNKDASDLFLLLRETTTTSLALTMRKLLAKPSTAETSTGALRYLRDLFASDSGTGIKLLRDAVEGIEDQEIIAESCMLLAQDLLDSLA